MLEPIVKVCGLTRLDDARHALTCGANALGFVAVSGSPRAIPTPRVAAFLSALPRGEALTVLVLAGERARSAGALARAAGVDRVQLCGSERPEDFRGFPLPIWRRVAVDPNGAAEIRAWEAVAEAFVLDHPSAAGGTGRLVDLDRAADLARRAPCLLAGGLHAGLLPGAVARVRPLGVDASSALERSPGRKDPGRVEAYVLAARAALGLPAACAPPETGAEP